MVEIRNLEKSYEDFSLKDINITVKEGEFLTLLGESGSGKSTLLRSMAGIEEKIKGSIRIDGNDVKIALKRGDISMVFQDPLLLPHLTVKGNVMFGLKMRKVEKAERERRYQEAVKELEIEALGDRYPSELSGGQRQRVSIARALVMNPKLLLMDEPFSALDTNLRERLQELLKKIQKHHGTTIVFVTHDRNEAFYLSSRIAVMRKGKIEQVGTPEEIYNRPKNIFIARFLGMENILNAQEVQLIFKDRYSLEKNQYMVLKNEDLELRSTESPDGNSFPGKISEISFKNGFHYISAFSNGIKFKIIQNEVEKNVEKTDKTAIYYKEDKLIFTEGEE